jgi:CRISPR-associated protein Cmr4
MSEAIDKDILFIHALTGLHPGSGTALGAVDMPIQRERHTQWPVIPGSSIKGVLRDACREKVKAEHGGSRKDANEKNENLIVAFGPSNPDNDNAHAGAVSFTDARILAFPVRSLKGVFAWVTCPSVLERYKRDLKVASETDSLGDCRSPGENQAAFGSALNVDGRLVLEEFDFGPSEVENLATIAEHFAKSVKDSATAERIKTHLVILNDDDFTHFVRHATEVVARVGLDYDKKTAKNGALFYQEFLPAETIFYSVVLAADSRKNGASKKSSQILKFVHDSVQEVIQIGADETIGKGLCSVKFMKSSDLTKSDETEEATK